MTEIGTISLKVKVAGWVKPFIEALAFVNRRTGWVPSDRSIEHLANFIVKRGLTVLVR